jgi:hypothetical protein
MHTGPAQLSGKTGKSQTQDLQFTKLHAMGTVSCDHYISIPHMHSADRSRRSKAADISAVIICDTDHSDVGILCVPSDNEQQSF